MQPHNHIGLGVAGNFTGHLEQAGEAADFVGVRAEVGAPKGIFPWFCPGRSGALGVWPVSADTIRHPGRAFAIQTEPEVGLRCAIVYDATGNVKRLDPTGMAAWNDCSIRRPPAAKISAKKNWGPASKGCAPTVLPIAGLAAGGEADRFRLACFVTRDGRVHAYGEDSPLVGYSYFHERLLNWLVGRMNDQVDEGPLEAVRPMLAGRPEWAWVSIGATRYTAFGEATMLEVDDVSTVVVYDAERYSARQISAVAAGEPVGEGMSVLRQRVVAAER